LADVIDLLAVTGPLECDLLAAVAGWPEVDEARRRGLIAVEYDADAAVARLGHPLYGEVRRWRNSGARGRHLRGLVVRAMLDAEVGDSQHVLRHALLWLESDLQPDTALFTEAAGTRCT
jgi:hypothetical protein